MTAQTSSPAFLLQLAAEGMAPAVAGCAAALGPGSTNGRRAKGIDYFGPRIVTAWLSALEARPRAEQTDTLIRLAALPAVEGVREAADAVERAAAAAAPEDRALAVQYLAAIPLAVRRALVPDPATGRPALPPALTPEHELSFLRLLPTDVPPFPVGTVLPGTSYQLDELIGIGGFGAVYRARNQFEQNQPPRAIKFCLESGMVATLHRERAILDRLMAVGNTAWSQRIVRLYGYALDGQPPFLVYEYVPGGDLTSHLRAARQKTGRGFRPAVVLELVRQVAEALAFAHDQGLVHRDLKPANILVSGSTIKLTDFGIGGVVASHSTWTGTGVPTGTQASVADHASLFRGSGTPLYMSPEQRRGENPDPRHDLYSLGVVWYQLLVGDVARELHPGWPDELIEEFGVPPEHLKLIQRCVGYFKKRPANAGELLALLPAPGVAAARAGTDFDRLKAQLADQIDRDALAEARVTVEAILRLRPDDPEALEARAFLQGHGVVAPRSHAVRVSEVHGAGSSRVEATDYGPRTTDCLGEHRGWVRAVALKPDGKLALSGGDDQVVRAWDVVARRERGRLAGHAAAVTGLAVTADGRLAVSAGWDGTLRVWDLEAGRPLRQLAGGAKVKCVAVGADGALALSGGADGVVRLWDLATGDEVYAFEGHADLVQGVAFSPDGRLAASGGDDHTVRLWDLDAGRERCRIEGHADAVTAVALAADGGTVFSASSDLTARLWDVANGREVRRFTGHGNWVNALAVTADGRRLLTGSGGELADGRFRDGGDTTVRLWDVATGAELGRWAGHRASVTAVALSADGRRAVSGSLDGTVRLWELPG